MFDSFFHNFFKPSSGGGAPSGTAGGDLGGTYPNPTVKTLHGIINGSSPAAGTIGEVITSNVPQSSPVSGSINAAHDMTSITLTAGVWLLFGNIAIGPGSTPTLQSAWISTTSASVPADFSSSAIQLRCGASLIVVSVPIPAVVVSISNNTTYYLSFSSSASTGTASVYGNLTGVRIA
jgi:hypothetical protein